MLSADAALSEDVACPNEITKVGGKKKKVATNELKNKKTSIHWRRAAQTAVVYNASSAIRESLPRSETQKPGQSELS